MGSHETLVVLLVFTVILVIMSVHPKVEAQDCNGLSLLSPCSDFLTKGAGQPPPPCCQVVQSLANGATSGPAKQQSCECIKSEISILPAMKDSALTSLPSNCRVNFPFRLSKNMNCSGL